jgi:hypothetical protein
MPNAKKRPGVNYLFQTFGHSNPTWATSGALHRDGALSIQEFSGRTDPGSELRGKPTALLRQCPLFEALQTRSAHSEHFGFRPRPCENSKARRARRNILEKLRVVRTDNAANKQLAWPAPGSADIELGVLMEPEVCHGETEVYTRVQA